MGGGCTHHFCYDCLLRWARRRGHASCPMCRAPITSLMIDDEFAKSIGATPLPRAEGSPDSFTRSSSASLTPVASRSASPSATSLDLTVYRSGVPFPRNFDLQAGPSRPATTSATDSDNEETVYRDGVAYLPTRLQALSLSEFLAIGVPPATAEHWAETNGAHDVASPITDATEGTRGRTLLRRGRSTLVPVAGSL